MRLDATDIAVVPLVPFDGVVAGMSSNTGLSMLYVGAFTGDLDRFMFVKRLIKLTVVDAAVLGELCSLLLLPAPFCAVAASLALVNLLA